MDDFSAKLNLLMINISNFQTVEDGRAPGKPEATRVKVPPVELDGSRPKEMSGMRPRGRSRKRGIF